MLCHSNLPALGSAGPAGVTVFFVLSGFLITSLLVEERDRTGWVRLMDFYWRRFRRLAPAFVVWAACVTLFGLWYAKPWFFQWTNLAVAALYVSNWKLAFGGWLGAFNGTWSLAVEEQFYIVWPLVILALRKRPRALAWVAGAVLVGSLGMRLHLMLAGAPGWEIYYRTDTSASGLAAGAVLAAVVHLRGVGRPMPTWASLGLLGVSLLVPTGLMFRWVAPVSTLASVGLLHRAISHRVKWLGSPVLVWFGRRSYGLYLWHMAGAWLLRDGLALPWPEVALIVFTATPLLAEISWRLIERPFQALTMPTVLRTASWGLEKRPPQWRVGASAGSRSTSMGGGVHQGRAVLSHRPPRATISHSDP